VATEGQLSDKERAALAALVGEWTFEATHPMVPDTVVRGRSTFEWLEGHQFLVIREANDHELFPDSVSIIGNTDGLKMHYFDSRGVHRINEVSIEPGVWKWWREEPSFSQRFTGTFEDDGSTITGMSQLCRDDKTWKDDLAIVYRRTT
jgi:hypothetical protein